MPNRGRDVPRRRALLLFIVGDILGGGIYARTGEIGGAIWTGFAVAAIVAACTASISAVLVALGDLTTLADTTVLLLLIVFIAVHAALLKLRREPAVRSSGHGMGLLHRP